MGAGAGGGWFAVNLGPLRLPWPGHPSARMSTAEARLQALPPGSLCMSLTLLPPCTPAPQWEALWRNLQKWGRSLQRVNLDFGSDTGMAELQDISELHAALAAIGSPGFSGF